LTSRHRGPKLSLRTSVTTSQRYLFTPWRPQTWTYLLQTLTWNYRAH